MQKITLCLNNTPAAILTQDDENHLELAYNTEYLHRQSAIPLSLALPLTPESYGDKFVRPFLERLLNIRDISVEQLTHSPVVTKCGNISFAAPILADTQNYTPLDLSEIESLTPQSPQQTSIEPLPSVLHRQPHIPVSLIDSEFFNTQNSLLSTHLLKMEMGDYEDLVTNEIFTSLMAYNIGLPIPNFSRIRVEDQFALVMDRPDRQAPDTPGSLPAFTHCERFTTALCNFSGDIKPSTSIPIEAPFELLRHYSSRPAVDFRSLVRAISLSLICGVDDFDLLSQPLELGNKTCRLSTLNGFICTDIYPDTRKLFLSSTFGIHHMGMFKRSHIDDLARKMKINSKYLHSVILDHCIHIPKIASEILAEFATLKSSTTIKILRVIEHRSRLLMNILDDSSRAARLEKVVG